MEKKKIYSILSLLIIVGLVSVPFTIRTDFLYYFTFPCCLIGGIGFGLLLSITKNNLRSGLQIKK